MNYIYIPDTFNYNLILNKFENNEKFIECQIKYKIKFEELLSRYINIKEINDYIESQNIDIPRILDDEYNFYHKYSKLGNNYIYIRNNYHVENLSKEEIKLLLNNDSILDEFFIKTYQKVLFENGEKTYFGPPMNETEVNSKSIIFEFAYNQLKCKNIEQLNKIKLIANNCFKLINKNLNIISSFIIYNGIPDQFYNKNDKKKFN